MWIRVPFLYIISARNFHIHNLGTWITKFVHLLEKIIQAIQ